MPTATAPPAPIKKRSAERDTFAPVDGLLPPAPIKKHSAALFPLWFYLTIGIYWLFWLHRTYRDIRAHAPGVTTITPGKAVGFLFIPVFNIYWFLRVVIDFPRAIARMQKSCHPQEEPLPAGAVSTMFVLGALLSALGASLSALGAHVPPAAWAAGQILVLTAIVSCQQAMNAHSENHARALRGQAIVAASGERSFARLIGTRAETIEWTRVAVLATSLAVAGVLEVVPRSLSFALLPGYEASVDWTYLLSSVLVVSSVAKTGAAVLAFRLVKNDWLASLLAGLLYALLSLLFRIAWEPRGMDLVSQLRVAAYAVASAFFCFAFLSMFVKVVRSAWTGLGLGTACGWMANLVFVLVVSPPSLLYYRVLLYQETLAVVLLQRYFGFFRPNSWVFLMVHFFTTPIWALAWGGIFALTFWIVWKLLVMPTEAKT